MTGTLTDIVADMMAREDADGILLDDGADVWCLETLYDVARSEGDGNLECYEEDGTIYDVRDDGIIGSRIYWPVDISDDYTRQRLLDSGYDLPDID